MWFFMHKILSDSKNIFNMSSTLSVEFMDDDKHVLIIAPITQASKFKLSYKVVWVCLMDHAHRMYISRRASHLTEYPNLWDFSTSGCVLFQEAYEDAAIRQLSQYLNIYDFSIHHHMPCSIQINDVPIFATIFIAKALSAHPKPNLDYVQEGLFLDKEELMGLAFEASEFLTPNFLWAINKGLLKI